MTINSNAMTEPNKTVSLSATGYIDYNIPHSIKSIVGADAIFGLTGYLTIEPGRYKVTFDATEYSPFYITMMIRFKLKSGEYIEKIRQPSDPDIVTYEIDTTNIENNSQIWIQLGYMDPDYSVGYDGFITFEPIK